MKILFLLFLLAFTGAVPRVNENILGGHDCKPHEAKYHVALCEDPCNETDHIICGGTLIHPNWVLTAAHCDDETRELKVIDKPHDVRNIQKLNKYEVEGHIPHPHPYPTGLDFYFDIMLLKLKKPIKGRHIPIPTEANCEKLQPEPLKNARPLQFQVAGLGIDGYVKKGKSGLSPHYPQKLQCVTIPQSRCLPEMNINRDYSKNRFCAGGEGLATRRGDSGGGLVINGTVYGIVHRGYNDDTAGNYPGIYINVCKFRDWITKTAV